MKKVRLDLDDLRVESFAPSAQPQELRGSVAAHQLTPPFTQQYNCTWDARCRSDYSCPDALPYSYGLNC